MLKKNSDGFSLISDYLDDVHFKVIHDHGVVNMFGKYDTPRSMPIAGYRAIVNYATELATSSYKSSRPDGRVVPYTAMRDYLGKKYRGILYNAWKEERDKSNPKAVRMQHRIATQGGSLGPLICLPEFYENDFIWQEMQQYRSFTGIMSLVSLGRNIAQSCVPYYVSNVYKFESGPVDGNWIVSPDERTKYSKQTYHKIEAVLNATSNGDMYISDLVNVVLPIWRDILSPTGKSYRALNLLLDNYPGNCLTQIPFLGDIKFIRPIYRRRELLLNIYASQWNIVRYRPGVSNTLIYATDEEIVRAINIYNEHITRNAGFNQLDVERGALSTRKNSSINDIVRYIRDALYIDGETVQHTGKLPELMRKAIRDHDRMLRERIENSNPEKELAKPNNFSIAEDGKIRFLATVGDLHQESSKMNHCVYTYADRCVRGEAFIYHVEYKGSSATVEINRHGGIVQSKGPYNSENAASKWARTSMPVEIKGGKQPFGEFVESDFVINDNGIANFRQMQVVEHEGYFHG